MVVGVPEYLAETRGYLRLPPRTEQEIIGEIHTHLEDRIQELQARGFPPARAVSMALEGFGPPREVARLIYRVHSQGSWGDAVLAASPYLVLALFFAFHLWQGVLLLGGFLLVALAFALYGWRRGRPLWCYPWLGCSMVPAVAGLLVSIFLLTQVPVLLASGSSLPTPKLAYGFLGLYVFLGGWFLARTLYSVLRRDWLYASFVVQPLSVLYGWLLTLYLRGNLLGSYRSWAPEVDAATAVLFLTLAIASVGFVRLGERRLKLGVLVLTAPVAFAMATLGTQGDPDLLGLLFLSCASLALLLSPFLVEMKLGHGEEQGDGWAQGLGEPVPRRM